MWVVIMAGICLSISEPFWQPSIRCSRPLVKAQVSRAVASAWYTAWVDAGQPDLLKMEVPIPNEEERKEAEEMKKIFELGKIMGRPEEH